MAAGDMKADWWHVNCEVCAWRTRKRLDTKPEAIDAGHTHSQEKHPESWSFRVRGYRAKTGAAPAHVMDEMHGRLLELLAKVLEYEHALEHVVQPDHHHPAACEGCQRLARSALDGDNREGFTEIARDTLSL